ncbi:MAG: hypothetical protein R3F59_38965, partial [Myxococcota bacterium]
MQRTLWWVVATAGCGAAAADVEAPAPVSGRVLEAGCGTTYDTLQAAVNAAVSGDAIDVCPGTYDERVTVAGKQLTLRSTGGAAVTTLNGAGWGGALVVRAGADVTVDGLTIVNGRADVGGDLSCSDSALQLRNSVLSAGRATRGAGLGAVNCTGVVEANTFEGDDAWWSGGGAYVQGAGLVIRNNVFRG